MMSPKAYANPYLAGVGLGVVLTACFVLTGQGLGASGAFGYTARATVAVLAPHSAGNGWFQGYAASGVPWIVVELLGVILGGGLSAVLAGRFRIEIAGGAPRPIRRLLLALGGGMVMGLGAVLARGCTSGQALSGGAILSVGSWIFMLAVFAGGFVVAPLLRRIWS